MADLDKLNPALRGLLKKFAAEDKQKPVGDLAAECADDFVKKEDVLKFDACNHPPEVDEFLRLETNQERAEWSERMTYVWLPTLREVVMNMALEKISDNEGADEFYKALDEYAGYEGVEAEFADGHKIYALTERYLNFMIDKQGRKGQLHRIRKIYNVHMQALKYHRECQEAKEAD